MSRFEISGYTRGRVKGRTLLVGSYVVEGKEDRRQLYRDVLGVDMREGPGVDKVVDMEEDCDLGKFEHIECLSVLEHCRRPWLVAANIIRHLSPGGTLHVEAPFVWRIHAYPDDYYRFTTSAITSLFDGIKFDHLMYETQTGLVNKVGKLEVTKAAGKTAHFRSMVVGFGRLGA